MRKARKVRNKRLAFDFPHDLRAGEVEVVDGSVFLVSIV
jgi:hypothetical protein